MAGKLSAAQLARFQAVAQGAMDLSGITLKRPARTPNQWGGYAETLTTIASNLVGAWAKPSAGVMQQYAGLIGARAAWVVRLPAGTSLKSGDLLVMPSGDTLSVQADLSEHSYATCVQALATEVR